MTKAPTLYLRNATTTPLDPRVRERMISCLDEDPSREGSLLGDPRRSSRLIEEARERVARLIGAASEEIVFTSGGTEASNLALKGAAFAVPRGAAPRRRILVGATESTSILHPARTLGRLGFDIEEIPVARSGALDLERLAARLDERVLLVSVGLANAETGVIQSTPEIAGLARGAGALLHADATVAAAHLPLDIAGLGVDLMSLSAHRMYGPRGAGALFVRRGVRLAPLIEGGVEESGRRGGSPAIACLSGFGEAAAIAAIERPEWRERSWAAGRLIATGILRAVPEAVHHGSGAARVEAMVNVSVPGVDGEALLLDLSRAGIAASSGSACVEEAGKPSHVLVAMGVSPRLASGSILLAAGRDNDEADAGRLVSVFGVAATRLRRVSAGGLA